MTKVLSRFLVFLLIVLAVVSVGLTLFYFLRSDEVFSFSEGKDDCLVRYVNTGETLDVTVYRTNASGNTYTLVSSDETILKLKERVSENVFRFETAENKGGNVEVKLQTSNTKYANLSLTVRVGDGTKANPFFVRNYTDLSNIGKTEKFTLSSCYTQVADIDMSVSKEGWTPIGDVVNDTYFSGIYNGNGHSINNFSMTSTKELVALTDGSDLTEAEELVNSAGLFYALDKGGVISRLNLNKVTISGDFYNASALVIANCGTIQFVNVTDLVINNTYSGALVGGIVTVQGGLESLRSEAISSEAYSARVMYCSVKGSITSKAVYAGGLVGGNIANGLIMNNYANVNIRSELPISFVGGIVGLNTSYRENSVDANIDKAKASVINNYAVTNIAVSAYSSYGSIIGYNYNVDNTTMIVLNPTTDTEKKYNRIYGNYYMMDSAGMLVGIGGTTVSDSDYIATGLTSEQMKKVATTADLVKLNTEGATIDKTLGYVTYDSVGKYVTWNFSKTWDINANENSGLPFIRSNAIAQSEVVFNGVMDDPIEPDPIEPDPVDPDPVDPDPVDPVEPDEPDNPTIMTQDEFRALFENDYANDNLYNGSYVISKNVVMDSTWEPIGTAENPFNGKFIMTNGAKIINLHIEDCDSIYYGLFGYVGNKAYINGVSIEGVKIVLDDKNEQTVYVGALAGYCEAKGVNNSMYSLLARLNNESYITASSASGFDGITVSNKKNAYVGGAIGQIGSHKFAYNLHTSINITVKNISENASVGGIVGINDGYVEASSCNGNINATGNSGANVNVGGVVGENLYIVDYSYFGGVLKASDDNNVYAGGIAGLSLGSIQRCSVKDAQLHGGYYVGGLVGVMTVDELLVTSGNASDYEAVSESYASGSLNGKRVGGLAGEVINGTIANSYTTANLKGEYMAGFVVDLQYDSDAKCGKVKYCYSGATFETSAGKAYWETASVIRQTSGKWANNTKLAGYVENCIYNTHDNDAEQNKKIDSIVRQYAYSMLGRGYECDDGRSSDEECKKISTFTSRGSGFDTSIWNLVEGSYPTLSNVA